MLKVGPGSVVIQDSVLVGRYLPTYLLLRRHEVTVLQILAIQSNKADLNRTEHATLMYLGCTKIGR